jgi:hypothetical protein
VLKNNFFKKYFTSNFLHLKNLMSICLNIWFICLNFFFWNFSSRKRSGLGHKNIIGSCAEKAIYPTYSFSSLQYLHIGCWCCLEWFRVQLELLLQNLLHVCLADIFCQLKNLNVTWNKVYSTVEARQKTTRNQKENDL